MIGPVIKYFSRMSYVYWHDLSDLKAIGNKKSIEMVQKGLFLPFLIFSQTKTMKTECFFSHYATFTTLKD